MVVALSIRSKHCAARVRIAIRRSRQFESIWAEPKDERGMATIGASRLLAGVPSKAR